MAENKSGPTIRMTSTSISEKASEDAIPELAVFQRHFNGLTRILFNTNLTPHLIEDGVIALADQEELDAKPTSSGKASFVLPKVSSALAAGETGSFYKMLHIMKYHGNHDAQQLSDAIASEIPEPRRELLQSVTVKKMDEFSLEFSACVADIAEILEKSANLNKFVLVCCNVTTPEKSLILTEKEISQMRNSKSVFDIFVLLRDHWRWDNHRLLYILIKRTGSREALDRLNQFRKKVDYTMSLNDLSRRLQSVHKPPPPGYTRMRAIIDKDYSEFTLTDCKELDKYLADAFGGTTFNPPELKPSNSIQVTWYIPTEVVSGLLGRAYEAKETFQLLSISFFEIDQVVVWNKKWPYSLQVCEQIQTEIDNLKAENQKFKKLVSADHGYGGSELIATLPDDPPSLSHIHSQLSTQVEQLRAEVSQVKINISQLDTESKKLRELNKNLQNKEQQVLRAKQEEIGKAKQEIAELSEKINQCNLNLKTAHNDVAVKESEKKELQETLKKANDEADKVPKLQEQIKELSTKVTQLEDKEKLLDEEVKKCKSDLEEKNKEVDKLHEKLKMTESSRNEYIKELDAKNAELSDVMNKAREQVDNIRQDLDKVTAEKDKLEREYTSLQKNNTGAQASNDDLIKELQTKNTELSSGRDKDKKQLDEIQQNLEKVTTDKNKLERECARVKQINVEMKYNQEKLTKEIEKKDEELSRVRVAQQEQLKTKQPDSPLTDTMSTQGKIIQSLRKQKEELIEQNNSLRSRNDSLTKEKKQLLDQIEYLRQPKSNK